MGVESGQTDGGSRPVTLSVPTSIHLSGWGATERANLTDF